MVFTMESDICRVKLGNVWTTLVTTIALSSYVLLIGFVSDASPQRTYQRACDCEYMLNGKCAYTLLLPTGSNDGSCPDKGAGSEDIEGILRNMTNRVNKLFEVAVDQSAILTRVQDSIIYLQRNNQPSRNDSGWPERPDKAPASYNDTLQTLAEELDGLKKTTAMLARNLSTVELKLAELSNAPTGINGTKETPVNRTTAADDNRDAKISQLSETVRLLRQASCARRAALFSGPDRLNGTSITVSSSYNNDNVTYGPQQLAIDNTGSAGAWCPKEPPSNEWVQFDIGRTVLVFGIATRARHGYEQWISNYTIQYVPYSSSGNASDGDTFDWVYFKDIANENEVFQGNTDRSSIQLNMLWRPIFTRYVRILPLAGFKGGNVCARADIVGCVDEI